jgi:hypothetical protein
MAASDIDRGRAKPEILPQRVQLNQPSAPYTGFGEKG